MWAAVLASLSVLLAPAVLGVVILDVRDCPATNVVSVALDYETASAGENSLWQQQIKRGVTRACNSRTACCTRELAAEFGNTTADVLDAAANGSLTVGTGFLFGTAMDGISTAGDRSRPI
jgi:hypothetical protein